MKIKKTFALAAILFLAFSSCAANAGSGEDKTIFLSTKTEKVNSVSEILYDLLPKYQAKYKKKIKGGNPLDSTKTFLFGPKSTGSKPQWIEETIPVVVFKGSFAIHQSDWEIISNALKKAKGKIRVTLDFSECRMEKEQINEGEKPSWYLPSESFSKINCLSEIHFPEGLTAFGSYSFCSCKNLRAVFFPKNTVVHSIGHQAFSDNHALEEVHLYQFDGALGECFRDSGVKAEDEKSGEIRTLEMPDHPVYLQDYGMGYYQYAFGKTKVKNVITKSKSYDFEKWVEWGRSLKPKTGVFSEIAFSSELDKASGKYSAKNVANASWQSWVEGSAGDGSGEALTLTLKNPTSLEYICIKNGFGNLSYYWANNRAKDITLFFDDDEKTAEKYTLDDTPLAQYIYLQKYDKLYSKITLKIESVYKGTDGANDLAIDEIAVNAGIERRQVYGGFYTTDEVPYVYSPEVQRMLKGLYFLDVGEKNVRVSKEGFVEVRTTDWESGEKYWTRPSGAFSGTLYKGFFLGTGGGHSYDCFHIYLNPNGSHYLFIWHEESYGTFELYPVNLQIYAWKNQTWTAQSAKNHDSNLNEIFSILSMLEKRGLAYAFFISESDGNADATITAYPKGGSLCLPVTFSFEYDGKNGVFLPYIKTSRTELSFGSVESLKAVGDWKADYEKTKSDNYHSEPIQIFSYPACYNADEKVVRFLFENGFKVENEYKRSDGKSEKYRFTALEAWQAGRNNNEVRKALIEAGAGYTSEMLVKAFESEDIAQFREFLPLVNLEERKVILPKIARFYSEKKDLSYIKNVLLLLKENGVSLDSTFYSDGIEKNITLMDDAFGGHEYFDELPLVKLYMELGLKIPNQIKTWSYLGGTTTPIAVATRLYYKSVIPPEYAENYDSEEKAERAEKQKKLVELFDFLIKNGVDLNARDDEGDTAIHNCCGKKSDYADVETIRYLIKLGCDVNVKNDEGFTPLTLIAKKCESKKVMKKIVEILIDAGADVNATDKNGMTVLSHFIENNFDFVEDEDESTRADFWLFSPEDELKENLAFAEYLFSHKADPNCLIGSERKFTALQLESCRAQKDLCALLIKYGADVNKATETACFPPVLFAMKGLANPFNSTSKKALFETVKLLVKSGADCSIVMKNTDTDFWDDTGRDISLILLLTPKGTALDENMRSELMELFLAHGASTEKLTEKMLKKAGFSKEEIKKIVAAR